MCISLSLSRCYIINWTLLLLYYNGGSFTSSLTSFTNPISIAHNFVYYLCVVWCAELQCVMRNTLAMHHTYALLNISAQATRRVLGIRLFVQFAKGCASTFLSVCVDNLCEGHTGSRKRWHTQRVGRVCLLVCVCEHLHCILCEKCFHVCRLAAQLFKFDSANNFAGLYLIDNFIRRNAVEVNLLEIRYNFGLKSKKGKLIVKWENWEFHC